MNIHQIISKVNMMPDCIVYRPKDIPDIEERYILPSDILEFYTLCGGVTLFAGSNYEVNFVPPDRFVPSNLVIIGERCEEDMTSDWFIISNNGSGQYISIDLNKQRLGKCYDSYYDRYGVVGECPVIALSFTELLTRLVENNGDYWYWLGSDFNSLGDAYD